MILCKAGNDHTNDQTLTSLFATDPSMLCSEAANLPFHISIWLCRAAYGVALLHDGLGVNLDDASLLFTETIVSPLGQPIVLDWTLGTSPFSLPLFRGTYSPARLICKSNLDRLEVFAEVWCLASVNMHRRVKAG